MALGGIVAFARLGLGGTIALIGTLFWLAGCITFKSFGWVLAVPGALRISRRAHRHDRQRPRGQRRPMPRLIYRQDAMTRITHWVWAVAMFFLLLSGLQIFNARPNLYIGQESGFAVRELHSRHLRAQSRRRSGRPDQDLRPGVRHHRRARRQRIVQSVHRSWRFPGWATIPSNRDLATGRVVHFFFAWILVGTLAHVAGQRHLHRASVARHHPQAARHPRAAQGYLSTTSGCASRMASPTRRCRRSPISGSS